jgi:hypothetical protein
MPTHHTPFAPKVPKSLPQAHPTGADPGKITGDEVAEAAPSASGRDLRARSAARMASAQNRTEPPGVEPQRLVDVSHRRGRGYRSITCAGRVHPQWQLAYPKEASQIP